MTKGCLLGQLFVFYDMKKASLHTLGCKLNYSETSTIGRQLAGRGYEIVDADLPSDVFVLNTCSVTERADRECRQIIRRVLRRAPDTYVIVTGCYAQLRPEEIAAIQGVDLILGTQEKFDLFRPGQTFEKQPLPQVFVSCIDEATSFDAAYSAEAGGRTRAFLKIQDGCDYHCTFCTIPKARGSSRSQSISSLVRQAGELASQGFKEIVLTGVNIGDYGTKIGSSLFELMRELESVYGIDRFRISSIEPNLLTREMIEFVTSSQKFCHHYHIPLQSGSNTILRAMRRRYTTSFYEQLIDAIRTSTPMAGIGVDVIVGFPGESDGLFNETYKFLADLEVSYLHVFSYSERDNTPAVKLEGSVDPRVRQERSEMLRTLGKIKRRAFYESFVGQTHPVLFEENGKSGRASGFTRQYVKVEAPCAISVRNSIADVALHEASDDCCIGEFTSSTINQQGNRLSEPSSHNLSMTTDVSHEVEFR